MNPSQKASPPPGLELPVLTDVVDEPTLPVLTEEPSFELPDFDFSSELDDMALALPTVVDAVELDIPDELPLEAVLDVGPVPAAAEPVVDFSRLPSLDLDVPALDELALDEVLPGAKQNVAPMPVNAPAAEREPGEDAFEFVLAPVEISDAAERDGGEDSLPASAEAILSIDIDSLPAGVLGGGVGPEPEADAVGDALFREAATYVSPADESPAAVAPVPSGPETAFAVVDEQALIDSLTQKILPRMKVELSLWLQDALEMQARQMLSGVMHQLKEDYEMLFNETLRESLRQAINEIGRDEREGKS